MLGIRRILFKVIIILMLIFAAWVVSSFEIKAPRGHYDMSAKGTVQEFASIFKPHESGTATFRIVWWRLLIKEVSRNPKLLFFGKGFGPSLAVGRDAKMAGDKTRKHKEVGGMAKSPHNILITIFGRMGIMGLFLWLSINYTFFLHMLKGIKISRVLCEYKIHNILIWITCFILAIIGASLFAVLLESPFMAIPYFFFMGLGISIVDRLVLDYNRIKSSKGLA